MRRPVIVGVGEVKDRPTDPALGLDPLAMMATAAHRAEGDAGVALLARVDSVDVIHQISWRYNDTARQLCERLKIEPARAHYHVAGGESPLRAVHDAALRIAQGGSRVALICGGEARSTVQKARKAGIDLPWPGRAEVMENPFDLQRKLSPMAIAHGVAQPTYVYPFYENATLHAWSLSPAQASLESASLWARYADIAVANPVAWLQRAVSADEIAAVTPRNPLIAWPYTRLMVANPTVNLGAAMLVVEEQDAIASGIDPSRFVYFSGGAASDEPDDYLQRDSYRDSPSQRVVLGAAMALNDGEAFEALELYSCFPCVPKMARRTLGLSDDFIPSVAGGLTFFGGPFNDYMLHAACAMTRRLRAGRGRGLLYGQGDFVTKHHALLLSSAPVEGALSPDYRVDGQADALRGPVPTVVDHVTGEATLETFTVIYDRNGAVDRGIAILRTQAGERTMARIPAADGAGIARLTNTELSPIGQGGAVSVASDGLLEWRFS